MMVGAAGVLSAALHSTCYQGTHSLIALGCFIAGCSASSCSSPTGDHLPTLGSWQPEAHVYIVVLPSTCTLRKRGGLAVLTSTAFHWVALSQMVGRWVYNSV